MHKPAPSKPALHRQSGFSLPEVAMAIGIIAIAFVALIGLIPVGLNQLRTAMDSNNETRIVQGIVSLALASEYKDLNNLENVLYYFDEEGSALDTSTSPNPEMAVSRLYAAKVFVKPAEIVDPQKLLMSFSSRIMIVYGSIYDQQTAKLQDLVYEDVDELLVEKINGKRLTVRSVTIAKTDGK